MSGLVVEGVALSKVIERVAALQLSQLFGAGLKKLVKPLKKDPYFDAMVQALEGFTGIVLAQLELLGYEGDELEPWAQALVRVIEDSAVADELWRPLIDAKATTSPEIEVLQDSWERSGGPALPSAFHWSAISAMYRNQMKRLRIVDEQLRGLMAVDTLVQLRDEVRGAPTVGDVVRYAGRMRERYRVLDLADLISPVVEGPTRILLVKEAYVPQLAREDPPTIEVPRDVLQKLVERGELMDEVLDGKKRDAITRARAERLRNTYRTRPSRPVLEVLEDASSRKVVLIGDPGSGKSTLARYLLLSALTAKDLTSGRSPFPLLLELRDYAHARGERECQDFLSYFDFLGKDQGYFLNETWLHERLETGPSLVIFDGLDEIFNREDRRRVTEAIVGFTHKYALARVVVTTRPVGYQDQKLRAADFRHFGLEDLGPKEIETFVEGWFSRLFEGDPKAASLRITRVLGAAERSESIRLLAGNPMLLTIMCLIAQHRELPRDRASFYQESAASLCHHWDANRGLDEAGVSGEYLDLADKLELLRLVAFRMQASEGGLRGNFIDFETLRDEVQGFFEARFGTGRAAAKRAAGDLIEQLHKRNQRCCVSVGRVFTASCIGHFSSTSAPRSWSNASETGISTSRLSGMTSSRSTGWTKLGRSRCGLCVGSSAMRMRQCLSDFWPRKQMSDGGGWRFNHSATSSSQRCVWASGET